MKTLILIDGVPTDAGSCGNEIIRLRKELAACQKDADRYRWLRDSQHWPAVFSDCNMPEPLRGIELDEELDAAMKEQRT